MMVNSPDDPEPDDLTYRAWCVIANASDWDLLGPHAAEWREAAIRWRDDWHETLKADDDGE